MLLSKDTMHIIIMGQEHNFNPDVHIPACFIIDGIVVENGIYSREFFNLFNQSRVEEKEQYEDGQILLSLIHNQDGEEQYMQLDERLGSIMLSDPILIEVPDGSQWVTIGSKYIDGVFYP
jgi:hypothetical protein